MEAWSQGPKNGTIKQWKVWLSVCSTKEVLLLFYAFAVEAHMMWPSVWDGVLGEVA